VHGQQQKSNVTQIVDEACLCLQKAETKEESKNCDKIIEQLRTITSLSKNDSLYIISVFSKNGSCRKNSSRNKCKYLQDSDLSQFHLKKTEDKKGHVEWESDGTSDIKIISLIEYLEKFERGSESELQFDKMKQQIIEGSNRKLQETETSSTDTEVYSSEWVMDTSLIHIFAKYENWSGYTVITFRGSVDIETTKELVAKISRRMKEICR
jgi:hypothetical protein